MVAGRGAAGQAAVVPFLAVQQAHVEKARHVELEGRADHQQALLGSEGGVLGVEVETRGKNFLDRPESEAPVEDLAKVFWCR